MKRYRRLMTMGLLTALLPLSLASVGAQNTIVSDTAINPVPRRTPFARRLIVDVLGGGPATLAGRRADGTVRLNARQAQSIPATGGARRKYFITHLGTLGGSQSFGFGINDLGQVFGYSWITGDATGHAFLYSGGTIEDLGPDLAITLAGGGINNWGQIATAIVVNGILTPAIYDSQADTLRVIPSLGGVSSVNRSGVVTSVNDRGEAVGWAYIDAITPHAFLYHNGMTTDVGSFGGSSHAYGINDVGTVVGSSTNATNGYGHAFVDAGGGMLDIDPFGDADFSKSRSVATDINNLGEVVGYFFHQDRSTHHAFLYDRGSFRDIGSFVGLDTMASAINDSGQVVGVQHVQERVCREVGGREVCADEHVPHAFLYESGIMTDLNALIPSGSRWELVWAFDINSSGQIVGYGVLDGHFRAFLLTPATREEQCKNGGWATFGFENQGRCIRYVKD